MGGTVSTGTNTDLSAGLLAASTAYLTGHQEFFAGGMVGPYAEYTEKISTRERQIQLDLITNHPVMSKWLGARKEKTLRHYKQVVTYDKYEATLKIKRDDLAYGRMEAVSRAISEFFALQSTAYDKAVFTDFISSSGAGPTCYDGQALFSTAHPHAPDSGTWSNLASGTALSYSALNTAAQTMQLWQFENGEPMGVNPTHIEVGPKLKQRALELLGADRIVGINYSGAEATSSVVASSTRTNVIAGEYEIIINPRMQASGTGHYYWTLLDLSKQSARPMIIQENRFPEPVIRDSMTDPRRWSNDEFLYGLEGDFAPAAGLPQLCYRGTGTA
jgi:phage major head subunit gpT-like protein